MRPDHDPPPEGPLAPVRHGARSTRSSRSIALRLATAFVLVAALVGGGVAANGQAGSAACDLLHIERLGLDRCVVGGGQSEIDAGHVVRVGTLSNSKVHWLAGHRTSHGGTFRSLTDLRIGDLVDYRGLTHEIVDHSVVNRFSPGRVLDWKNSASRSVVLQTSKTSTYVYVWRAVAVEEPAPTPPPPPRPERPRVDLHGADTEVLGDPEGVSVVEPVHVADTRNTAPMAAGERRTFALPNSAKVPADVTTVFVNAVATGHGGRGYLTATSCSGTVPEVAHLNWSDRIAVSGIVAVRIERGQFCLESSARADVALEVVGFTSPSADLGLDAITPERLLDTRRPGEQAIAPDTPRRIELSAARRKRAPAAVQVTVAGIGPSGAQLWVHDCDADRGSTASIVMRSGAPVANSVLVPLDGGGGVCVSSETRAHVVVDLTGRFVEGGAEYQSMEPIRLVDTRRTDETTTYVGPDRLHGQETAWFSIADWRGLADTHATWLNVVSVRSDVVGFLTAWQCGETQPLASAQNPRGGAWVTSLTSIAGGPKACVYTQEPAHYVVDLVGVWVD